MKTKYAKDGMWLINGDIIVKSVNLPDAADPDVWHEITEAEYEALMESAMDENAATEADYRAALREMGVNV